MPKIISQDKLSCGDYEKFEIIGTDKVYKIIGTISGQNLGQNLGEYEDLEVAQEVLQTIATLEQDEIYTMPEDDTELDKSSLKKRLYSLCTTLKRKYGWDRHLFNGGILLSKEYLTTNAKKRSCTNRTPTLFGKKGNTVNTYEYEWLTQRIEIDLYSYNPVDSEPVCCIKALDIYESEKAWQRSVCNVEISCKEMRIIGEITKLHREYTKKEYYEEE